MSVMTVEGLEAWLCDPQTPAILLRMALQDRVLIDLPMPERYHQTLRDLVREAAPTQAEIEAALEVGVAEFARLRMEQGLVA